MEELIKQIEEAPETSGKFDYPDFDRLGNLLLLYHKKGRIENELEFEFSWRKKLGAINGENSELIDEINDKIIDYQIRYRELTGNFYESKSD